MNGANGLTLPAVVPQQAVPAKATMPGQAGLAMPGPKAALPPLGGEHGPVLGDAHGRALAMFNETSKAMHRMGQAKGELVKLQALGDLVTPEQVVAGASKLVAHGHDPMQLAGLLADMPQEGGGAALAGWIAEHATALAQGEQKLAAAHAAARHEMGVSALHVLAAHSGARGPVPGVVPQPSGTPGVGLQMPAPMMENANG